MIALIPNPMATHTGPLAGPIANAGAVPDVIAGGADFDVLMDTAASAPNSADAATSRMSPNTMASPLPQIAKAAGTIDATTMWPMIPDLPEISDAPSEEVPDDTPPIQNMAKDGWGPERTPEFVSPLTPALVPVQPGPPTDNHPQQPDRPSTAFHAGPAFTLPDAGVPAAASRLQPADAAQSTLSTLEDRAQIMQFATANEPDPSAATKMTAIAQPTNPPTAQRVDQIGTTPAPITDVQAHPLSGVSHEVPKQSMPSTGGTSALAQPSNPPDPESTPGQDVTGPTRPDQTVLSGSGTSSRPQAAAETVRALLSHQTLDKATLARPAPPAAKAEPDSYPYPSNTAPHHRNVLRPDGQMGIDPETRTQSVGRTGAAPVHRDNGQPGSFFGIRQMPPGQLLSPPGLPLSPDQPAQTDATRLDTNFRKMLPPLGAPARPQVTAGPAALTAVPEDSQQCARQVMSMPIPLSTALMPLTAVPLPAAATQTTGLPKALPQSVPNWSVPSVSDGITLHMPITVAPLASQTPLPLGASRGSAQYAGNQHGPVTAITDSDAGRLSRHSPLPLREAGPNPVPKHPARADDETPFPTRARNSAVVAVDLERFPAQAPVQTREAVKPVETWLGPVPTARPVLLPAETLGGAKPFPIPINSGPVQVRDGVLSDPLAASTPSSNDPSKALHLQQSATIAAPLKQVADTSTLDSHEHALPIRVAPTEQRRTPSTPPVSFSPGILLAGRAANPPAPTLPQGLNPHASFGPEGNRPEPHPSIAATLHKSGPLPSRPPLDAAVEDRHPLAIQFSRLDAIPAKLADLAKTKREPQVEPTAAAFTPTPPPGADVQSLTPAVALPSPPMRSEHQPASLNMLLPTLPQGVASLREGQSLPHKLPETIAKACASASGDEPVELLLDPAELGRLRFEMTTTGDRVQVNLSVERGETLDLLRRNVDVLRNEFREAGFDASTLTFGQWGKSGDGETPTARSPIPDDDLPAKDPAAQPTSIRTPSDQGLHLRI
jgi:hypothetical protein